MPTDDTAEHNAGTYHCPDCRSGFDGYHECPDGRDRVGYVCVDCGEVVKRTTTDGIDIKGIAPKKCGSCTLTAMAQR